MPKFKPPCLVKVNKKVVTLFRLSHPTEEMRRRGWKGYVAHVRNSRRVRLVQARNVQPVLAVPKPPKGYRRRIAFRRVVAPKPPRPPKQVKRVVVSFRITGQQAAAVKAAFKKQRLLPSRRNSPGSISRRLLLDWASSNVTEKVT